MSLNDLATDRGLCIYLLIYYFYLLEMDLLFIIHFIIHPLVACEISGHHEAGCQPVSQRSMRLLIQDGTPAYLVLHT